MQPVGQLAQVEKLHLEAGDEGASHMGGMEENVPVMLAKHRREGEGQDSVRNPPRSGDGGGSASTVLLSLGTWLHRQDHLEGHGESTERKTNGKKSAEEGGLQPGGGRLRRELILENCWWRRGWRECT